MQIRLKTKVTNFTLKIHRRCVWKFLLYTEDIICWIKQSNIQRECIKVEKLPNGNTVKYMNVEIFKGSRFFKC